jgi:hypoxanthine phosphoribosyltransferase
MNDLHSLLAGVMNGVVINLVALAVAYAIGRLLPRLLKKLRIQEKRRRTIGFAFLLMSIVSCTLSFSAAQSRVLIPTTLALIILGATTLYYDRGLQHIGKSISIRTAGGRRIYAHELKRTDLGPEIPLPISWDTIGLGAKRLSEQINSYSPTVQPDLVLGVNELGMIVASYLARALSIGARQLGMVRTGTIDKGTDKRYVSYLLPLSMTRSPTDGSVPAADTGWRQGVTILLVDGKIKSGRSALQLKNELSSKFKVNQILCAVFAACRVVKQEDDPGEIVFRLEDGTHGKVVCPPDFLAFFTTGDIDPPGKIR